MKLANLEKAYELAPEFKGKMKARIFPSKRNYKLHLGSCGGSRAPGVLDLWSCMVWALHGSSRASNARGVSTHIGIRTCPCANLGVLRSI